ncbi:SprT-like protein [Paenibacillus shirakamiensis]|uniref:Protein SprT-like n=1 Tax=Paenibacillus shirakamiensis TaxID=1265935 RepID=A0ABS4JFT5_9BACL|nr:SprT family protein [Paenibacillus shirakamiensis]MBP2000570.1 SprT-like protein [Paenibacillus shirakamiensis]
MTNEELQQWVMQISLESFGVPFRHRASFNPRLKTTGGRYFLKSHHIEMNPHQLAEYGAEELERIIKHELCHYHLHIAGRGYQHRDQDFKTLLKHVGGSRYCQSLPGAKARRALPHKYKLVCHLCGNQYLRKRRVDPNRYRCGKCSGTLALFNL